MERLTRRLLLGWALYGALTLATVLLLLWYRGVFLPCRSSRTAASGQDLDSTPREAMKYCRSSSTRRCSALG